MTSIAPSYQVEIADRYTVVTIAPQLASEQWGSIEAVGNQLVERLKELKPQALLVDLSSMEYIGSSSVALLVRMWKTIKPHDGRMAVINKHPVVLEVLQIAGLRKVWTIADTRDDALAELGALRQHSSAWPIVVELVLTAVAMAGLAILMNPSLNVPREVTLGLLFGGAGLGLLLGLVNSIRETGPRRIISLVALLACLAVGIVGGMKV